MHELSIVEALIEQVEKEVRRSGHQGRVTGLDLVVGRLSGVHADSLRFAFSIASPGTLLGGAQLRISEPTALCRCHACGQSSPIEELTAGCPLCGGASVTIEGGQELILQSIELED